MPLNATLPHLACPRCGEVVDLAGRTLRCERGHAYDLARQGYVNVLSRPAGAAADDADMVASRAEILDSGLYSPIADALARTAGDLDLPPGLVLDVGAGTGHYTAAVLDALPDRAGLALDLSAYAARRAARAHPRLGVMVGDVRDRLPVRDAGAALLLDVFAPRNTEEFARVLAPGAAALVVTPTPDHLRELVDLLDMPHVDPHKAERLAEAFAGFTFEGRGPVRRPMSVPGPLAAAIAAMGPAAHHVDPARLAALRDDEAPVDVTLSVEVSLFVRP